MTTSQTASTSTTGLSRERVDLIETLGKHRFFLRFTARDLTDEQAALRPTVSGLCLGGLIKHVTRTERAWIQFILDGPDAMGAAGVGDYVEGFEMRPGETLAGLLADYEQVARDTEQVVRSLPDLDAETPLPQAPWFEPGASWSHRRVLLHIIAETAQHAGHADIIREAIDGAKSMG